MVLEPKVEPFSHLDRGRTHDDEDGSPAWEPSARQDPKTSIPVAEPRPQSVVAEPAAVAQLAMLAVNSAAGDNTQGVVLVRCTPDGCRAEMSDRRSSYCKLQTFRRMELRALVIKSQNCGRPLLLQILR
jgi:hypothetical protein